MDDGKRARGMELATLSLLAESDEPVGSPRLVVAMGAEGIEIAEATAGRYLRTMDERGMTARIGRQGRVITESGRQRLQHLLLINRLDEQSSELVRILSERDITRLSDILNLRRVVEGEAARLAALRATDDERHQLCEIASLHQRHVDTDRESREVSVNFHLAVASAAHSPIVRTTVELLIEPVNDPFMRIVDIITVQAGSQFAFAHDHREVADAILRRDPAAAEQAMRDHVEAIIALVDAYLARSG